MIFFLIFVQKFFDILEITFLIGNWGGCASIKLRECPKKLKSNKDTYNHSLSTLFLFKNFRTTATKSRVYSSVCWG
jgi:hypothetical protein